MTVIHKLELESYDRVRPILAGLAEIHLHLIAILDGTCSGRIYVDDVNQPQTVYVISSDAHYLAGVTDDRGFSEALNVALPRDTYFVLFCDPGRWGDALDVVLKDTYAIRASRRYYTLRQLKLANWQARVPDGFSMQRVDAGLLARDLGNREAVVEGILDGWHSVESFLEKGFGFCLVHEAKIVSWSLSDYVSGDRCEMGINTDWHYRRQGFGTLAAAANAAHATARGFATIGWHCWENNVGSIGVAGNVGFELAAEYPVFINHWVAENITDMSQDEFRAFAESYEREFAVQPPSGGFPHVVAAKAWALSGDRQGCFRHLHKAVDLGWLRGADHLRQIWPEFFWNPDLDQMEEWQDLTMRFEPAGQSTRDPLP